MTVYCAGPTSSSPTSAAAEELILTLRRLNARRGTVSTTRFGVALSRHVDPRRWQRRGPVDGVVFPGSGAGCCGRRCCYRVPAPRARPPAPNPGGRSPVTSRPTPANGDRTCRAAIGRRTRRSPCAPAVAPAGGRARGSCDDTATARLTEPGFIGRNRAGRRRRDRPGPPRRTAWSQVGSAKRPRAAQSHDRPRLSPPLGVSTSGDTWVCKRASDTIVPYRSMNSANFPCSSMYDRSQVFNSRQPNRTYEPRDVDGLHPVNERLHLAARAPRFSLCGPTQSVERHRAREAPSTRST